MVSGRYNLATYFPVFLWGLDCEKHEVSTFWDLLDIISKSNCEKMVSLKTKKSDNDDKIPCVYCGQSYKERGLLVHYKSCKDSPKFGK